MNFTIELIKDFKLIYIRRTGAYGPENIKLMETFKHWANEKKLLTQESILLAVPHDDPRITPEDKCRYDVGLVSSSKMDTLEIESIHAKISSYKSGKYAVVTIPHTMEAMAHTWTHIFSSLMDDGIELDNSRSAFERYRILFVDHHLCEICIPIK